MNSGEQREVRSGAIGVAVLIVVGGIVAALAAAWAISILRGNPGGTNSAAPLNVAAPVQEAMPGQALSAYRAEKDALLRSYGWVDRDAGRARIPIQEAMQVMAERNPGRQEKLRR
jgi:hypothetical protein